MCATEVPARRHVRPWRRAPQTEFAGLIEAPGRVDYEDAYDLIEFDEEIARRRENTLN